MRLVAKYERNVPRTQSNPPHTATPRIVYRVPNTVEKGAAIEHMYTDVCYFTQDARNTDTITPTGITV